MKIGKVLSVPITNFDKCDNWWYNKFHEMSGYNKLNEVGLDINFNKYKNHGIEIRFFDHITDLNIIKESFEFIIYLMDEVIESNYDSINNPIYDKVWNHLMYSFMMYGKDYSLTPSEIQTFNKLLNMNIENDNINDVYYEIFDKLKIRHINSRFSNLCLNKEKLNIKNSINMNKCICTIS